MRSRLGRRGEDQARAVPALRVEREHALSNQDGHSVVLPELGDELAPPLVYA
jgi:hypothetical protein